MKPHSRIMIEPCGTVILDFSPFALGIVSVMNEQGASLEAIQVEIEESFRRWAVRVPQQRTPAE